VNTAAPHALKKRLLTLALSLAFLLTCLPAALAVDLNVDAGFYFKQSRGGTCTLASAAMMLRRRAYFDGLSDWTNVTENSVRSTAWANGLAHSFTYKEMQVGYATLPSGLQSKTAVLISLLEQHPEGSYSYMVLVTDSTGESLCFASDFTVSGSASSTQTYWSVKDAEGTKLQQTVQQMETTVETAAETTVSWFAKLFD
jgi:hypothetical protein